MVPAAPDPAAPDPAAPTAPASRPARSATGKASGKRGRATTAEPDESSGAADDLTFRQAQAAMELCLAQLQGSDLDVEVMGELHRRAEAYAQRCEELLVQAEQEVMQWDPLHPDAPSGPLTP